MRPTLATEVSMRSGLCVLCTRARLCRAPQLRVVRPISRCFNLNVERADIPARGRIFSFIRASLCAKLAGGTVIIHLYSSFLEFEILCPTSSSSSLPDRLHSAVAREHLNRVNSVVGKLAINIDINISTTKHKRIFKRTNLQPEYLIVPV